MVKISKNWILAEQSVCRAIKYTDSIIGAYEKNRDIFCFRCEVLRTETIYKGENYKNGEVTQYG